MVKNKLDTRRIYLSYRVKSKSIIEAQQQERTRFYQNLETSGIRKSGAAYKQTLDLLFRQIESRYSIFFKSIFEVVQSFTEFDPDLWRQISTLIANFIDRDIGQTKMSVRARTYADGLRNAVRDSILNDLDSRGKKVKSHSIDQARLKFLEYKEKTHRSDSGQDSNHPPGEKIPSGKLESDGLEAKTPDSIQTIIWLKKYGWKYKWYVGGGILLLVASLSFAHFFPRLLSKCLVSLKGDNRSIQTESNLAITKADLLYSQQGQRPYDDMFLYSIALHGTYSIKGDRNDYSMVVLYKNIADPNQRHGWFAIEKLDNKGRGTLNCLPAKELDPDGWIFHTSRLYLDPQPTPILAFVAVLISNETLDKIFWKLEDKNLGLGHESLSFLDQLSEVYISERFVLENLEP